MGTPQALEALQLDLMVMSGSHCLEVSSTTDQKSIETPQAPHHSLVHIENQFDLHILHPPPETHDPIAHALEESYVASHVAKHKLSYFCMFARLSRSKECTCLLYAYCVSPHHGTSIECLSCAFNLFFSVDTFKLRACWFSLFYLSCMLVCMNRFLVDHAFTNMGQPMS